MSSTIQVRVEDDLKKKSDKLFRDLGTDTTTAIRIFLTQAIANNGFPFEIKRNTADIEAYTAMTEEEILERLALAREHSRQGLQKDAKIASSDIRMKYGL